MNATETLTFRDRPVIAVEVEGTFKFAAFVFGDRAEAGGRYPVSPMEEQVAGEMADAIEYHACNLTDADCTDALIVTPYGLTGGEHIKVSSYREISSEFDHWSNEDLLVKADGQALGC
ncbi:hypothetical protein OG474_30140 [Kribbella sp. NBC_01505]|uniref:hypothetical protein n=1 Tax=Kribbella sp. NBC_01505 TaxID=2903580 RepID=UPI00386DB662